jgi:HSP20 family molecular chaperone IbpA
MLSKKLSLLALPLVATLSLQAANPFNDPFFSDPFGDDIFKEMLQMQKEMDHMFNRMQERRLQRSSNLISPLGTYKMAVRSQFTDKGDHYELMTNIPESKENHINIDTENGRMSITAKIVHEEEKKTKGLISRSSSVQMYQQAVSLPSDADDGSIKTAYRNGKLLISIAKKKGLATPKNTVHINGKIAEIKTDKPVVVQKNTQAKKVEITKEFDQTPEKKVEKKPAKVAEQSHPKEGNGTIKKEIMHTDKNSMI